MSKELYKVLEDLKEYYTKKLLDIDAFDDKDPSFLSLSELERMYKKYYKRN